jgi:PhnB protein
MRGFGPSPYFLFPGTARAALEHYRQVFGGELEVHTFAEFGRDDGPADAVAHGILRGQVSLYAADAAAGEAAFSSTGLLIALLGTGDPQTTHRWLDALAETGQILDPLQQRGWNAWDGQVRDRFGVTWLLGYETS